MSETHNVGLSLGSNLGNRMAILQETRDLLLALASSPEGFKFAPVYQTAPVGCADDTPDFYNTAVQFDYKGTPQELLKEVQAIEKQLGRVRDSDEQNAPRTIDIDILYFGDVIVNEKDLVIPHPEMLSRKFVLRPLHIIAMTQVLPNDMLTLKEHLDILDDENKSEPNPVLVRQIW